MTHEKTLQTAREAAAWIAPACDIEQPLPTRFRDSINALVEHAEKQPEYVNDVKAARDAEAAQIANHMEQSRSIAKAESDNRTLRDTIRRLTEEREALSEVASQAEKEVVTLKQERDDLRVGMESMTETVEALRALLKTADNTADAKLLKERNTLKADLDKFYEVGPVSGCTPVSIIHAQQEQIDILKDQLEAANAQVQSNYEHCCNRERQLKREQDAHAKTKQAHANAEIRFEHCSKTIIALQGDLDAERAAHAKTRGQLESVQANARGLADRIVRMEQAEARANTEATVKASLTVQKTDTLADILAELRDLNSKIVRPGLV